MKVGLDLLVLGFWAVMLAAIYIKAGLFLTVVLFGLQIFTFLGLFALGEIFKEK